jgi:hypothetical protein
VPDVKFVIIRWQEKSMIKANFLGMPKMNRGGRNELFKRIAQFPEFRYVVLC